MSEGKLRVLIADDSVVYRSQIKAALQDVPEVEIVGAAPNGKLALDKFVLTPSDLMVLDLEMPEMDGLQTLREISRLGLKCKVIMFSSNSRQGQESTMDALKLGASDFITKPDGSMTDMVNPKDKIHSLLVPKIRALFPEFFHPPSVLARPEPVISQEAYPRIFWDLFTPKILVIGSSTGGPAVLENIFSRITGPLNCPIVIAQHMPPLFTATLAERLSKVSGVPAKEAKNGETLEPNHIYIAPGDFHLRLEGTPSSVRLRLDQDAHINFVRPAVDPLFQTAAEIFKDRCLGLVLTGMGSDGKTGAEFIKRAGGAVVIQEEKSCTVFGMPGAVFVSGAYDKIATPDEIVNILRDKVAPLTSITKNF